METEGHHEYGPSNYSAWAECPRYEGGGSGSADASAGTAIHEELSKGLKDPEYETENPTARWGVEAVNSLADGNPVQSEVRLVGRGGQLDGVFGTADVVWEDGDGRLHVADMKSFSDGTTDYVPQLKGYAALCLSGSGTESDKVFLHVLHGGIRRVETVELDGSACVSDTSSLIASVKEGAGRPTLCKWCQYCARIGECAEANGAMSVVGENGVAFSRLSLCQKLVVCDAVVKLAETVRKQAKELAEASDDRAIEMDGIRYELRPWGGRPRCDDICALAGSAREITLTHSNRDGSTTDVRCEGLSPDEFVRLCDVSKSAVVEAIRAKNSCDSNVRKADIESWVGRFFSPTTGSPHFVRTK